MSVATFYSIDRKNSFLIPNLFHPRLVFPVLLQPDPNVKDDKAVSQVVLHRSGVEFAKIYCLFLPSADYKVVCRIETTFGHLQPSNTPSRLY
jgi:hypothetical protein